MEGINPLLRSVHSGEPPREEPHYSAARYRLNRWLSAVRSSRGDSSLGGTKCKYI